MIVSCGTHACLHSCAAMSLFVFELSVTPSHFPSLSTQSQNAVPTPIQATATSEDVGSLYRLRRVKPHPLATTTTNHPGVFPPPKPEMMKQVRVLICSFARMFHVTFNTFATHSCLRHKVYFSRMTIAPWYIRLWLGD